MDKLGKVAVEMKEGESVYDYHWFPMMNSGSPETCCLATTSQHQPIHLYDAFDGHIRATYRYKLVFKNRISTHLNPDMSLDKWCSKRVIVFVS